MARKSRHSSHPTTPISTLPARKSAPPQAPVRVAAPPPEEEGSSDGLSESETSTSVGDSSGASPLLPGPAEVTGRVAGAITPAPGAVGKQLARPGSSHPTIAETRAAGTEFSGPVSAPATSNPFAPRPMQLKEKIEGVKDYQERLGEARLAAGLPSKNGKEDAQNLGRDTHKVLDGMSERVPTQGKANPGRRMTLRRPGEVPTPPSSSQETSSSRSLHSSSPVILESDPMPIPDCVDDYGLPENDLGWSHGSVSHLPAQAVQGSEGGRLSANAAAALGLPETPHCVGLIYGARLGQDRGNGVDNAEELLSLSGAVLFVTGSGIGSIDAGVHGLQW